MKNLKEYVKRNREAIKPNWEDLGNIKTDRVLKLEKPAPFKHAKEGSKIIKCMTEFPNIKQKTLTECINERRSLRKYNQTPLTFEEVSYLLHETAKVYQSKGTIVFRTIPTGGATNGMETYVYFNNVKDYPKGLYHYIQDKHELSLLDEEKDLEERVNESLMRQLRGASVVFFLTAVPYRSEYKYSFTAHKMLAMEAGHAFQNLSLASEVIDSAGVCIAAYKQDLMDTLLQVDGIEEFATYAMPIGKK